MKDNIPQPPSLVNIFKEIELEYGYQNHKNRNLTDWANQGVLLLNSTLTVEAGKAGSHQGYGWEEFTDKVIDLISKEKENVVFILWGNPAQKKGRFINREKHCVLESPHPSPLSAYRGFFENNHFKRANEYLKKHNKPEIKW